MYKISLTIILSILLFPSVSAFGNNKMEINMENNEIKASNTLKRNNNIEMQQLKKMAKGNFGQMNMKKEFQSFKKEKINYIKGNFKQNQSKVISDFKKGKITLQEAKRRILIKKKNLMIAGKKELEIQKKELKIKKLNRIKEIIKLKIENKLKRFSNLSIEKKNNFYEKIIEKINIKVKDDSISKKRKLLYIILKDIFYDLLGK